MKPNFKLHPNESTSVAMIRLHKHIRTMKPDHKPQSRYAASIQYKKAMKPKLRLVK